MADPLTLRDLVDRALVGYGELIALGEEIEDEWSYVNDLATAWQERMEAVATSRGDEPASAAQGTAIDTALEHVARIEDPHRAIDWLSTFPQVVLLALGESRP